MLKKNDEFIIEITSLSSEGAGVGRYGAMAVFVSGALPNETVRARAIKIAKSYAVAITIEIISPSPERVTPPCSVFGKCGGCTLQHLSYDSQCRVKRTIVVDALQRLGGVSGADEIVRPTIPSTSEFSCRNKAAFPACKTNAGVAFGFFAPRSHRVVPIDCCPLQAHGVNSVMSAVKDWADAHKVPAYDESSNTGVLRHAICRTSTLDQLMAVIVTTGELPARDDLIERLSSLPGMTSIVHNINAQDTNVITGPRFEVIWGAPHLEEKLLDFTFRVSAESFLQVNPQQAEALYREALRMAELDGSERVVDAYCGIGTITLPLAAHSKSVTGVEIVERAIEDAHINASSNDVTNAEFVCAAAEEWLPEWSLNNGIDVLVLDPPRKGCDLALLDAASKAQPKRIVYVSCNPATLARDVKILREGGYELLEAQPVDMFPQTAHIETVALLKKA